MKNSCPTHGIKYIRENGTQTAPKIRREAVEELADPGQPMCLTPKEPRRISQQPQSPLPSLTSCPLPGNAAPPVARKNRWRDGSWTPPASPTSKSDYTRKCVLCLLINAVVIFGVLLALIVGHWASKGVLPWHRDVNSAPMGSDSSIDSQPLPIGRVGNLLHHPSSHGNDVSTSPNRNKDSRTNEQSADLRGAPRRIPSLLDIYPPSVIGAREGGDPLGNGAYELDNIGHNAFGHGEHGIHSAWQEERIFQQPTTSLQPIHYELQLDFTEIEEHAHIRGNVTIVLESFGNSTNHELAFHAAANIFIHRIRLKRRGQTVVSVKSVRRDNELVRLTLNERLERTSYRLEVEFRTKICQSQSTGLGATHCIMMDEHNISSIAGFTTKFAPYFARTFLPCWDDPRLRSSFDITIKHLPVKAAASIVTLTNGEVVSRVNRTFGGASIVTTTSFGRTPPMPVHQLAFAVGPFVPLETGKQPPVTLWLPSNDDRLLGAQFAANFSPIILERIVRDFGVPYPLPKLDILLTRKFPVAAVESWGLVVCHADAVLVAQREIPFSPVRGTPATNTQSEVDRVWSEYKVEKIITHQLVHQWFGNLIGVARWEERWLSEGFANYYAYDFLNEQYPHLTEHEYYLTLAEFFNQQSSVSLDNSPLIRRLDAKGEFADALDSGDSNSHAKGTMMVKMLKDLLGTFDFRAGVTRFLKQYALKSIEAEELWSCLPTFAMDHGTDHVKIAELMESWLTRNGIPEIVIERNYNDHSIRIVQRATNQNRYAVFLNQHSQLTHTETARKRETDSGEVKQSTSKNSQRRESTLGHGARQQRELSKHELRQHRHEIRGPQTNWQKEEQETLPNNKVPIFSGSQLNTGARLPRSSQEQQIDASLKGEKLKSDQKWWLIPFSYAFGSARSKSGQTTRQFWLLNETVQFFDIGLNASVPLLANPHWIYPYRVNYDERNWRQLIDILHTNHNDIPPISRLQLLVDGEIYLRQSDTPELYLRMLAYLAEEKDLSVLLIGLDRLHSLIDLFSGAPIATAMMSHLLPVLEQMDRFLTTSRSDPRLAALWLAGPLRLVNLVKLRCFARMASCQQSQQLSRWLTHPTSIDPSNHQQTTAICHFLYGQALAGGFEITMLKGLLQQANASQPQWSVLVKLATCVHDEALIASTVQEIIRTRNANIYLSVLGNSYSFHHNPKFREIFWRALSHLPVMERLLLFGVSFPADRSNRVARALFHSVRTIPELELVESLLERWPERLQIHFTYLRRKLAWIHGDATKKIQRYLEQ